MLFILYNTFPCLNPSSPGISNSLKGQRGKQTRTAMSMFGFQWVQSHLIGSEWVSNQKQGSLNRTRMCLLSRYGYRNLESSAGHACKNYLKSRQMTLLTLLSDLKEQRFHLFRRANHEKHF